MRPVAVDHLVLARYVGAAHEVAAYREAIPCATVTVCRVTAPVDTVQDRLRRRECGVARDFLMALSISLAAEIEELAFEDFVVDNGPDRSVTDVAASGEACGMACAARHAWLIRAMRRTTAPQVRRSRTHP